MISDAWKLCERLSIVQAALLIAGYEPSHYAEKHVRVIEKEVLHFLPIKTALLAAIEEFEEFGKIVWIDDEYNNRWIDFDDSFVRVKALRTFLSQKNVADNYFSDPREGIPGYLQPDHPRYAPQLAAALEAWLAVSVADDLNGKTPKQAIEKWLRENAAKFGMTNEDGIANESAIERIARICNWQPQGGAPATPSPDSVNPPTIEDKSLIRIAPPVKSLPQSFDLDDDIPF